MERERVFAKIAALKAERERLRIQPVSEAKPKKVVYEASSDGDQCSGNPTVRRSLIGHCMPL